MINTIVVDDERHARQRLIKLLSSYPEIKVIHEIDNGDKLIQILQSEKIDVAFLDINMPGPSVFNTISSLHNPPLIVFQTAYSEYAVNAFSINAIDYLMKPITRDRLDKCISKIKKAIKNRRNEVKPVLTQISVKYGSIMKVINIQDIFAIRTEEGFSFIHTARDRFLSDKSLNYFENILSGRRFYRISRTAIVNLDYVKVLHPMFKGSYSLELTNGTKITVARRRMKKLKELLAFL